MTGRDLAVWILLGLGTGTEILCCLGLLLVRGALNRLHYAAAGATVGPVAIAAAVVLQEKISQPSLNALLVACFLLLVSPLGVIEAARAARRRRVQ